MILTKAVLLILKRFQFIGRQGTKKNGIRIYCRSDEFKMIIDNILRHINAKRYTYHFIAVEPVSTDYGYIGYGPLNANDDITDPFWIVKRAALLGIRGVLQRNIYGEKKGDDVELLSEETGSYIDRLDIHPQNKIPINVNEGIFSIPYQSAKHLVPIQ